jgi:hypothetical protein
MWVGTIIAAIRDSEEEEEEEVVVYLLVFARDM